MKKTTALFLTLQATLSLSAVGALAGKEGVGVPNPASAQCEQSGGKEVIFEAEGGQDGLCTFGDKSGINSWTLWRQLHGEPQLAVQAFFEHAKPGPLHANPASVYCGQVGGELDIVEGEGGQLGICRFSDNSQIEEWTLFSGPSERPDLANALK